MRQRISKIIIFSLLLLPLVVGAVDVSAGDGSVQAAAKANAKAIANELDGSWIERVGGIDSGKIYRALAGSDAYRAALQSEYYNLTKSDLRNHLNHLGKNNSDDVIAAKLLLDQGRLTTVDKIFLHTHGVGTKEKLLFSDLVEMAGEEERANFQGEWFRKFSPKGIYYQGAPSVVSAIEGDLSGDDRILAMKIYNRNLLSEDEVARAVEITGKSREEIINRQVSRIAEKSRPMPGQTQEEYVEEIRRAQESFVHPLGELPRSLPFAEPLPRADCGPTEMGGYRLCVALPGQSQDVASLGDYIRLLYQFALAIAGIVVFMRIIYGGVMYTLSAGNVTSKGEAMKIITQAIWGLVLLLAAVLILYTVNPRLLDVGSALKSTMFGSKNVQDVGGSSLDFDFIQPKPPTTR